MATPVQMKMRDKYADILKQIKSGKVRLNLGENNHVDFGSFAGGLDWYIRGQIFS